MLGGLLDAGAGISDLGLLSTSLADEVLLVATPDPTAMPDAHTFERFQSVPAEFSVPHLVNKR
jgi:MinD-like ATPase involved in chromosome partitioning or flagellar assembly